MATVSRKTKPTPRQARDVRHKRLIRRAEITSAVTPGSLEIVLATRNPGKVREFLE